MGNPTVRMSSLEETSVGHHCQDVPLWDNLNDKMTVRMPPLGGILASWIISGQIRHFKPSSKTATQCPCPNPLPHYPQTNAQNATTHHPYPQPQTKTSHTHKSTPQIKMQGMHQEFQVCDETGAATPKFNLTKCLGCNSKWTSNNQTQCP